MLIRLEAVADISWMPANISQKTQADLQSPQHSTAHSIKTGRVTSLATSVGSTLTVAGRPPVQGFAKRVDTGAPRHCQSSLLLTAAQPGIGPGPNNAVCHNDSVSGAHGLSSPHDFQVSWVGQQTRSPLLPVSLWSALLLLLQHAPVVEQQPELLQQ